MSAERVALGPLVFDETQFEVPEDLTFGLTTLGGVADIPQTNGQGAIRASQTSGTVPEMIQFDAWFLGPTAESKRQMLYALQTAQAVLTFQRGAISHDVVIYKTTPKYRNANEIGFSLELEPLSLTSAVGGSVPSSATVQDNADAITALIAQTPPDAPSVAASANATNAIENLEALGPVDAASVPDLNDAVIDLVAAIDLFQVIVQELAGTTDAADVASYLYAAQMIASLSVLIGSLGPFTGALSTAVLPGSMNLYELAVHYTGDIGNADSILAANPSITDPFNLGSAPISIPGL